MRILGFEHTELLYELANVGMGIGTGIIISNIFPFSVSVGLSISVISLILSIYIWHRYIKNKK